MRYYGNKTKLLKEIEDVVCMLPLKKDAVFLDIFSGTSSVGSYFKKQGYCIYANDFLKFSYTLTYANIKIDKKPNFNKLGLEPIEYLNNLAGRTGFITKNYSPYKENARQYVSVFNAKKIDVIREEIEKWKVSKKINNSEYYYLLASLLKAINLVSNVTGTYAAYLKNWDNRALKKINLEHLDIISNGKKNRVFNEDANKLIRKIEADLIYIDPPYNSRQYASNYFFLELIAEGWFKDLPKIYGKSGMRPYEHQKSDYSSKHKAFSALQDLVSNIKAKYIILSYNDEGIIPHNQLVSILGTRGKVTEFRKKHKRYRAINQDGSHTRTTEILYLVEIENN